MRVSIARFGSALAFFVLSSMQHAVAISVFNTGVDSSGSKLAVGSTDPHWQLVAGPGVTTPASAFVVNNQHPSGQYFETTDSAWIWSTASGIGTVGSPYTFRLQFDLTGVDLGLTTIAGSWGVDNIGAILLNGAAPLGTGVFSFATVAFGNFNLLHAFTINGGFVPGINSLDVQVTDAGNPGGFNMSNLTAVTAAVPEPSTAAMLWLGIITLFGLGWRHRAQRVAGND